MQRARDVLLARRAQPPEMGRAGAGLFDGLIDEGLLLFRLLFEEPLCRRFDGVLRHRGEGVAEEALDRPQQGHGGEDG